MDTRLKKSKKIRSFIYRMIAAGALMSTLAIGILGREAVLNLYREGLDTLTGNIFYHTEFREFTAYLYNQGMLGYAGIGDDNGYPLSDEKTRKLTEDARAEFHSEANFYGENLLYYAEYNGKIMDTNISYPIFSEFDGHLLLPEDVTLCCYWDGEYLQFFSDQKYAAPNYQVARYYDAQYKPNTENVNKVKLLIAVKNVFTNSYFTSNYLNNLAIESFCYRNLLIAFLASAGILFISWFLCLFTVKAGKRAKTDYAELISKVYTEIRMLTIAAVIYLCYSLRLWDFAAQQNLRFSASANWGFYFPAGILLYLFYTDIKGNGEALLTQTFVYRTFDHIRSYINAQPWYRRAIGMYYTAFLSAILLLTTAAVSTILALCAYQGYPDFSMWLSKWICLTAPVIILITLLPGLALLFVSFRLKKFVNDTASVSRKLSAISAGQDFGPLLLSHDSLLLQTGEDLNSVGNGIQTAVEQKNQSNKMRVDLIANVSHDLKTPLTSIINYADLLCEEALPDPACEYAEALRSKAYRLKGMVQDVFDLSKATSGNLPVEKTTLDLAKLIRQTLADMDERITESTLTFKLSIIKEPLYIEADGEKLYRVFQNLILNALQYSLEHSRVHVHLEQKENLVYARIKNISRHELNFSSEEIMERFVRADTSRTSEGSGLGLSIVRSFTEACGGTFTIEMDADLFTACIVFPTAPQAPETSQNTESSSDPY